MSFEDHIKQNKEKLDMKKVNPLLWDNISMSIDTTRTTKNHNNYLSIGGLVIVILLLIAYVFRQGQQQSKILDETQQQLYAVKLTMNSLLNEQSSFSRIKAVNLTSEIEHFDPEITRALLYTVQNDKSKNVQLAALNAIEKFAEHEEVKTALITTLKNSDKPFVQIKIINILSSLGERRAIPLLEGLIASGNSPDYLKEEAIHAKDNIQNIY